MKFELHGLCAMAALEAADDEMAARQVLEMFGEGEIDRRAADGAEIGTAWAANFSPATTPKRAAIWVISRAMSGAPSLARLCPARKRALSATERASAARTAK